MYAITFTSPATGKKTTAPNTPTFSNREDGLQWLLNNAESLPHPARQYGCHKISSPPISNDARDLVLALAGSLTPATLAAAIADIGENDQPTEQLAGLAAFAARAFRDQLNCMVGESEAASMLCDCCGRGQAKIGWACDHCGETIECDARG